MAWVRTLWLHSSFSFYSCTQWSASCNNVTAIIGLLRKGKGKGYAIYIAHQWITPFLKRSAWITQLLHCKYTMPALPRSSPGGATNEWTVIAPADEAYYSFIDPVMIKDRCADQWKFAGRRLTFYHWATQPTKYEIAKIHEQIKRKWEYCLCSRTFLVLETIFCGLGLISLYVAWYIRHCGLCLICFGLGLTEDFWPRPRPRPHRSLASLVSW